MKIQPYIDTYEELFKDLQGEPVKILELGVLTGASLLMWNEYFTHQDREIIGLDMNPPINFGEEFELSDHNVFQYQGMQDDVALLQQIVEKHGPFDIIIDDASHRMAPTHRSWSYLKNFLKPGGFYVIEDWGTGYWDSSRGFDGEEYKGNHHNAGMVGLIKELVEEVASEDLPGAHHKTSEWKNLDIRWGQAILRKKA
jgi:hypothetical protein